MRTVFTRFVIAAAFFVTTAHPKPSESTRAAIDRTTEAKGTYTAAEEVHRVSFPRPPRPLYRPLAAGPHAPSPRADGPLVIGDILLPVAFHGGPFRAFRYGKHPFEVEDDSSRPEAAKLALPTKADSATHFSDLQVHSDTAGRRR